MEDTRRDKLFNTLKQRESTHGSFAHLSATAYRLKSVIFQDPKKYSLVQKEALDMICTKLARLVTGDPNHVDTWHDIAGYAELVCLDIGGKVDTLHTNFCPAQSKAVVDDYGKPLCCGLSAGHPGNHVERLSVEYANAGRVPYYWPEDRQAFAHCPSRITHEGVNLHCILLCEHDGCHTSKHGEVIWDTYGVIITGRCDHVSHLPGGDYHCLKMGEHLGEHSYV